MDDKHSLKTRSAAFYQHSDPISGVSMTTLHSVMTTEEPPQWRVEHPDFLSASYSESHYHHGYKAIPSPLYLSVRVHTPNSSLVW